MSLTINCDLDGVAVQFEAEMKRLSEGYLGRKLPTWVDWSPWAAWEMDQGEWYECFNRSVMDGVFRTAKPVPGAIEALTKLVNSRHRLRFVTSKVLRDDIATQKAMLDCIEWLGEYRLLRNNIEVAFTHNKQGYAADVVIDDKPDLAWAQRGAKVNILFDQPWNRHVELPHDHLHVVRGHGWEEVMSLIKHYDTVGA